MPTPPSERDPGTLPSLVGGPAASGHDRAGRRAELWTLAAGLALVVGIRLWATSHARFPFISADEPAYLSMARLLGGRGGWNLGDAATYGPAYSALVAPWERLGLSPDHVYRAAIWTNLAIWAGSFLVLEVLARRLAGLRRPMSVLAAVVATLPTSLIVLSGHAWSDALAVLALLLVVLSCTGFVARPGLRTGLGVAAAAAFGYSTHSRLAPAAVVAFGLLLVWGWRRRLPPRDAAAAVVALPAGMLLVHLASSAVHERLYEAGATPNRVTSELGRILDVWPVTLSASGQIWYLAVTTAGIAGVGVLALLDAARGRRPDTGHSSDATMQLRVTGALLLVSFGASAGFMADRTRPDHLIYGRYNDALVGLLVVLGLARLASHGWRRAVADGALIAVVTITAATLLRTFRSEELAGPYSGVTIRSLGAIAPWGPARLVDFTVVGLTLLALVVLWRVANPRRPEAFVVGVCVLALLGAVRGVAPTVRDRPGDPRAASQLQDLVDADDEVVFLADPSIPKQAFFRFPFYAPDLRLVRSSAPVWEQGAPWVLAPATHEALVAYRYELRWSDPVSGQGLWQAPGPTEPADGTGSGG